MHGFLSSGSTVMQIDLETTATSGPQTCGVIGDAIPIS
jgi:hypothetical protein